MLTQRRIPRFFSGSKPVGSFSRTCLVWKDLRRKISVGSLMSSQKQRTLFVPVINCGWTADKPVVNRGFCFSLDLYMILLLVRPESNLFLIFDLREGKLSIFDSPYWRTNDFLILLFEVLSLKLEHTIDGTRGGAPRRDAVLPGCDEARRHDWTRLEGAD